MKQNLFPAGDGKEVPPELGHVIVYFQQKGKSERDALDFFNYFESRKWMNQINRKVANWKKSAWEWIWYR